MEQNQLKKLSASSISTYLSCPLRFKFRHIDKIEAPADSPHLIYGSAIHTAIQAYHNSVYYGKRFTKNQIVNAFEVPWFFMIETSPVPVKWYRISSQKEMTDSGINSIKNYYEVHKNDPPPPSIIRPNEDNYMMKFPAVETYFTISLGQLIGREDWCINGIIDLVQNTPDGPIIVDHKTGSSKYSDFKVKTDLQLAVYSYAFRDMCNTRKFPDFTPGTIEKYVMFDILSKKKPEIYYHKRIIGSSTYKHLGVILTRIIGQIERSEFLPNYGATCESYGGCEYLDICGGFKFQ